MAGVASASHRWLSRAPEGPHTTKLSGGSTHFQVRSAAAGLMRHAAVR